MFYCPAHWLKYSKLHRKNKNKIVNNIKLKMIYVGLPAFYKLSTGM